MGERGFSIFLHEMKFRIQWYETCLDKSFLRVHNVFTLYQPDYKQWEVKLMRKFYYDHTGFKSIYIYIKANYVIFSVNKTPRVNFNYYMFCLGFLQGFNFKSRIVWKMMVSTIAFSCCSVRTIDNTQKKITTSSYWVGKFFVQNKFVK